MSVSMNGQVERRLRRCVLIVQKEASDVDKSCEVIWLDQHRKCVPKSVWMGWVKCVCPRETEKRQRDTQTYGQKDTKIHRLTEE